MSLQTEWIHYGSEGQYTGYAARLSALKEPVPAVVVLQEIWGVDEHIQDVTRRIAQAGYTAFAPDLYARDGARPPGLDFARVEAAKSFLNTVSPALWRDPDARRAALERLPASERDELSETLELLFAGSGRMDEYVRLAADTCSFLREQYEYSAGQGVCAVGFCLGGAIAGLLAAEDAALRGAVVFYGNPPGAERAGRIRCPLLGLYGELDRRITDAVAPFAAAMEAAGRSFEYHVYPHAPHAFFNDTRPVYHAPSARDAWVQTLAFLNRVLQPA